ncbi:MAG: response regulator [Anaerolineae bacterium]|nr:response regulator [Anaerolineae bacterium]
MPDRFDGRLEGWLVLLVDDEPDSLEVVTRWLKLAGATVLTACDGKAGLEIAVKHRPDFILADLSMPVMDGWEMQYKLKNNPEMACIPVIALTAHALQYVEDRVVAAGFAAHIAKPFKPEELISEVLRVVRGKGVIRSGSTKNGQK